MNENDGGAAFPRTFNDDSDIINDIRFHQHGMSLRDYFAAKAMNGILAFCGGYSNPGDACFEALAKDAYKYADAMLAERKNDGE